MEKPEETQTFASSINEFRSHFEKVYFQEVRPILTSYESQRKIALTNCKHTEKYFGPIIGVFLFLVFFCMTRRMVDIVNSVILSINEGSPLLFFSIFAAIFQALFILELSVALLRRTFLGKKIFGGDNNKYRNTNLIFEQELKKKLLPTFNKCFLGFNWYFGKSINYTEFQDNLGISIVSAENVTWLDNFEGKYKGLTISLSEIIFKDNNWKNKLDSINIGIAIKIQVNKNFKGKTFIRPTNDIKIEGYQKVNLEDVELSKNYYVYSNDQIEARYLLTTGFITKINEIRAAFNYGEDNKRMSCTFNDGYFYMLIHTNKDMFSLSDVSKPITDTSTFAQILKEFTSILELVEYFKFSQNIGL